MKFWGNVDINTRCIFAGVCAITKTMVASDQQKCSWRSTRSDITIYSPSVRVFFRNATLTLKLQRRRNEEKCIENKAKKIERISEYTSK